MLVCGAGGPYCQFTDPRTQGTEVNRGRACRNLNILHDQPLCIAHSLADFAHI